MKNGELTGKCKVLFEKWYNDNVSKNDGYQHGIKWFYQLPSSMQFGVIQDFADSLGYLIEILVVPIENTLYRFEFDFTIYNQNEQIEIGELGCETRQEARNAAIEKLNEIINQNK